MDDIPLIGEHQSINTVNGLVHLFNRNVCNNPTQEFFLEKLAGKWNLPVVKKSVFTVNINPLDEGPTLGGMSGEMKGTSFHCSQSHTFITCNNIMKEYF